MNKLSRLLWVAHLVSCADATPQLIRIEPIVRSSCGLSPVTYDISCVHSLQLTARTLEGEGSVSSTCTPIAGRFANVQELLGSNEVIELLEGVQPNKNMIIELRAFHAFNRRPCDNPSDSELMIWGSSAPVDTSDPALAVIPIDVECRPDCDCEAFETNPTDCPVAHSPGICAPPSELPCRKRCESTDSCYGGLLACEASSCDDGGSAMCCSAVTSQTCAVCAAPSDCESGICAYNSRTDESFCAEPCPPTAGSDACPPRMSCKRVGNSFSLL